MINIYYCNWDIDKEVLDEHEVASSLNRHLEFNERNYRWVDTVRTVNEHSFPLMFIGDRKEEEEYYLNIFKGDLDIIRNSYNKFSEKKIRDIGMGDVIEFKTKIISIKFAIKLLGFELI